MKTYPFYIVDMQLPKVRTRVITIVISNPNSLFIRGILIKFIPYIPAITGWYSHQYSKRGKTFITILRLLEITEAKKSIVLANILLYISVISIACLFSIITSSNTSLSSSYFCITSTLSIFSKVISLAFKRCREIN